MGHFKSAFSELDASLRPADRIAADRAVQAEHRTWEKAPSLQGDSPDKILFGDPPYRTEKNNKRWLRQMRSQWTNANPNTVPPWLDKHMQQHWHKQRQREQQIARDYEKSPGVLRDRLQRQSEELYLLRERLIQLENKVRDGND